MASHQWMSDEEWLAARREVVTATDAPAVIGVSPWKSALQVYCEKLGLEGPSGESERMAWGRRLEGVIAEAYAEETGRKVAPPAERLSRHPRIAWMGASLDRLIEDPERGIGVLEIKTTAMRIDEDLPLHWLVQVAHQLEVAQARWGSIAVLQGGNRLLWRDVEVNEVFTQALLEKEEVFWRCVEGHLPPPPDGSDSAREALRAMYRRENGQTVDLPPESGEWARRYAQASEEIKRWTSARTEAQNLLLAAMGEAAVGVAADGSRFSNRLEKRGGYSVAGGEHRVFRRMKA